MEVSVTFGKWLKYLFFLQLAHLALFPLGVFTQTSAIAVVAGWVISAGTVCILLQLAPAGAHYRKAGIFRGVELACTLITRILFASTVRSAVGPICGLIAAYQEYNAHSDVLTEKDPELAKKWGRLFVWIVVSNVLAVPITFLTLLPEIGAMMLAVVGILGAVLNVLYLVYLHRMRKLFE